MKVRLVVRAGDPRTVGDALARHGVAASAVADGRVFASGKRVDDASLPVSDGDEIVVEAARTETNAVAIVSEYRGLYAVGKPPGLPTEPDRSGTASVVHAVAGLLRVPPSALHAATRLDASVSGLVVVARGHEAMRLAADLKARGDLRRRYLALATRAVEPRAGSWNAPVRDGARRGAGKGERAAVSRYAVVATAKALPAAPSPALLVVEPITGRTHQIRIHASGAGAPLLGDVKYGGPRRLVLGDGRALTVPRVSLHAARVEVRFQGAVVWTATASFPADLSMLWSALGGDLSVVEPAVEAPSGAP
ncbi:MAG TPA: RNA pseudouridine synthase [Polyangiaceae bacterium]|nr:RNA pseudouridine synthase [Polyangiaceae bacterium]